ncbi:MAG: hypothetical protein WCW52_05545 [Elusimicrobiales bacterium]
MFFIDSSVGAPKLPVWAEIELVATNEFVNKGFVRTQQYRVIVQKISVLQAESELEAFINNPLRMNNPLTSEEAAVLKQEQAAIEKAWADRLAKDAQEASSKAATLKQQRAAIEKAWTKHLADETQVKAEQEALKQLNNDYDAAVYDEVSKIRAARTVAATERLNTVLTELPETPAPVILGQAQTMNMQQQILASNFGKRYALGSNSFDWSTDFPQRYAVPGNEGNSAVFFAWNKGHKLQVPGAKVTKVFSDGSNGDLYRVVVPEKTAIELQDSISDSVTAPYKKLTSRLRSEPPALESPAATPVMSKLKSAAAEYGPDVMGGIMLAGAAYYNQKLMIARSDAAAVSGNKEQAYALRGQAVGLGTGFTAAAMSAPAVGVACVPSLTGGWTYLGCVLLGTTGISETVQVGAGRFSAWYLEHEKDFQPPIPGKVKEAIKHPITAVKQALENKNGRDNPVR